MQASTDDNQSLRRDLSNLQCQSPRDGYTSSNGTVSRSTNRNVQQLAHLRDLFESKTIDFNETLAAKSEDLQRICSQITQTITEF